MSIEDILQALDDQCREECQDIFKRAQSDAKQILDRAQVEADVVREVRLNKAKAEAQSETTSLLYTARLKSKNDVIKAKEKVAEKAMAKAEEDLKDLRSRGDYAVILENLINEGLYRVSGKVLVHVDPADRELADSLLRKMGLDYELLADIETIGGAVISDEEGRVMIINSIEERLNRAREKLRMEVSGILFEEEKEAAVRGG
jgi:V/A-type H+/Na+-transporting ATPase subunit E